MNCIKEFLHVALYFMFCKVVLTFKLVDKTYECHWRVLNCGTVYYATQTVHKFFIYHRLESFKEYYKIWPWTEVKMVHILTKNSPCSTNNRQRYRQSYAKRSPHKWGSFIQEPNIRLDKYVSLYIYLYNEGRFS